VAVEYEMAEITLHMNAVQFEAVQTVLRSFVEGVGSDIVAPEKFKDYVDTIQELSFTFANPWDSEENLRLASVTINQFLGITHNDEESRQWVEEGSHGEDPGSGIFTDEEWEFGFAHEQYVYEAVARFIAARRQ